MLTIEQNITAVLETCFAGFKDELINEAAKSILRLIDNQGCPPAFDAKYMRRKHGTDKRINIQHIDSVSAQAMKAGYSVTIRHENSQRKSKTFISDSNVDENSLTLSAYPIKDEEDKTTLYADGEPVIELDDTDEEEEN